MEFERGHQTSREGCSWHWLRTQEGTDSGSSDEKPRHTGVGEVPGARRFPWHCTGQGEEGARADSSREGMEEEAWKGVQEGEKRTRGEGPERWGESLKDVMLSDVAERVNEGPE